MISSPGRTLLAAFAHPDDEVFGTGGTIALESDRGTRVVLALATGGEAGEIVNAELRGKVDLAELPAIRQQELRCSAETLGISEVVNLGYRDSGMAGTPENQREDAFANQDDDALAGRLVQLIREERPQVIITFDARGGYGHPDHIKIHQGSRLAFERAGDRAWYPDAGEPWQPDRLFYWTTVREQFTAIREDLRRRGIPMETGFESMDDEQLAQLGAAREDVTTVVDIRSTLQRKFDTFYCYATQTPPDFFYLKVSRELLGEEFFVLMDSTGGKPPRHGLFEGLSVDG